MSLGTVDTRLTRRHAHRVQQEQSVPAADWAPVPEGSYLVALLFNLMAAFDEGHTVLAVGPASGNLMTYSYYRQGNALKAPALMACLRKAEPFLAIRAASGWIVHGNPGNWWNEHMDAAVVLSASEQAGKAVAAYAEQVKAAPGTYDLVTHNCLTFAEEALAAGGIRLVTVSGKDLRTFVPKDAFEGVTGATGATPYEAWKYWFDDVPAPKNGLRTISDDPETERGDRPRAQG
ncbi:hypothetical protein AAK967_03750 [Atopobiaceae bacterium 24-176]